MTIIQANKFYFIRGGAERYLFQLSDWLKKDGQEVIPFAMQHPQNFPTPYASYFPSFVQTEQPQANLAAIKTLGRMFYSLEARRKMSELIHDVKPDICHIHNIYTQISPSILSALSTARIPIVMTVHDHHLVSPEFNNTHLLGTGKYRDGMGIIRGMQSRFHKDSAAASFLQIASYRFQRLHQLFEKHVSMFLVPCEYMAGRMIASGYPKDRIRVAYYGIEPVKNKSSDLDGEDYVFFAGRLSKEKGVDFLLKVARELPDISFKIAGTGPEESILRAASKELSNVEWIGFKDEEELQTLYAGARAVLMPSRFHELFPMVALEAMQYGVPIIANAVGGIPEIVRDRETGFILSVGDIHGWVEAVMRIFHDRGLRQQMSRAAEKRVKTVFRPDRHFDLIMETYEEVIEKGKRGERG